MNIGSTSHALNVASRARQASEISSGYGGLPQKVSVPLSENFMFSPSLVPKMLTTGAKATTAITVAIMPRVASKITATAILDFTSQSVNYQDRQCDQGKEMPIFKEQLFYACHLIISPQFLQFKTLFVSTRFTLQVQ
jgi:hypothetical protein